MDASNGRDVERCVEERQNNFRRQRAVQRILSTLHPVNKVVSQTSHLRPREELSHPSLQFRGHDGSVKFRDFSLDKPISKVTEQLEPRRHSSDDMTQSRMRAFTSRRLAGRTLTKLKAAVAESSRYVQLCRNGLRDPRVESQQGVVLPPLRPPQPTVLGDVLPTEAFTAEEEFQRRFVDAVQETHPAMDSEGSSSDSSHESDQCEVTPARGKSFFFTESTMREAQSYRLRRRSTMAALHGLDEVSGRKAAPMARSPALSPAKHGVTFLAASNSDKPASPSCHAESPHDVQHFSPLASRVVLDRNYRPPTPDAVASEPNRDPLLSTAAAHRQFKAQLALNTDDFHDRTCTDIDRRLQEQHSKRHKKADSLKRHDGSLRRRKSALEVLRAIDDFIAQDDEASLRESIHRREKRAFEDLASYARQHFVNPVAFRVLDVFNRLVQPGLEKTPAIFYDTVADATHPTDFLSDDVVTVVAHIGVQWGLAERDVVTFFRRSAAPFVVDRIAQLDTHLQPGMRITRTTTPRGGRRKRRLSITTPEV